MHQPLKQMRFLAFLTTTLAGGLALAADQPTREWPRFRGPSGTGQTSDENVPTKWTNASVVWKTELKGLGQSSPIIWGDRVFLTSALEDGRQRMVFAVDRTSGKVLWEQVAWTGNPEKSHKMNGWASPSCTTDGQHVWAWFGKGGVHCYTAEGKHVWSEQLGEFGTKNARGTGSSAVLFENLVILNGDSETDPYIFALDKLTGKTVWKAERPADEGYSTPVMITANGKPELVLNGSSFIAGYDPTSGKQLWKCKAFAGRGEPMPAISKENLLLVVNGLAGDVYAVKPGGEGDVTKTHMAWHTRRNEGRDEPSPLVVGDYLLVSNMTGVLTCYNASTGKELCKERIGQGNITAAPMAAGGKGYFTFESGETVVVEPGEKLKIISRNKVDAAAGELFRAALAPVGGKLYLRSDRALYCIQ